MRQTNKQREIIASELHKARLKLRHLVRPTFTRKVRIRQQKAKRLIAYDFETTRIKAGTPNPVYVTAFASDYLLSCAIRDMTHLTRILKTQFLTEDNLGCAFVAWNANRFDAYFVAAALIRETDLVIYPYMTKSKTLRGLRVIRACDRDKRNAKSWEFLDGIAMTGLAGVKLEKFVATFAPNFPKLTGTIDFEKEEFDPNNEKHIQYAFRDSEGLYHAITRAQQIMVETFEQPLAVTMGGACIKIFAAHIPIDVEVEALTSDLYALIQSYVMRGGYCFCNRRYTGPVWKYDINQAYASAMRSANLPAGFPLHHFGKPKVNETVYIARVTATNECNKIPFYYRRLVNARIKSDFAVTTIDETWLTSIECEQLISEGWNIDFHEIWTWPRSFSMVEYVDKLERLRTTCEGGPSGAIGTMVKATGNHSYGKTVERIEPIEFILASECPDDYVPWYDEGFDPIEHIFYRIDDERKPKAYHQPQLGAWITAHVRMVVRRAALINPETWLYADTDCVIFSSDVTDKLDIDPARYGAWKIEESGARYQIIGKKIYREVGGKKRSAKGMNVNKLSDDDFQQWYEGKEPMQEQIQIQNFLAVMSGAEMFRTQKRSGTKIFVE